MLCDLLEMNEKKLLNCMTIYNKYLLQQNWNDQNYAHNHMHVINHVIMDRYIIMVLWCIIIPSIWIYEWFKRQVNFAHLNLFQVMQWCNMWKLVQLSIHVSKESSLLILQLKPAFIALVCMGQTAYVDLVSLASPVVYQTKCLGIW